MSNYYTYRDIKVMIAEYLMTLDGWLIYDYSPDRSDPMSDYYCPANWGGVAVKNGYIFCVNASSRCTSCSIIQGSSSRNLVDSIDGAAITRGVLPKHLETPRGNSWHLEKDGVLVAKGKSILKFRDVCKYMNYSAYQREYKYFGLLTKDEFIKKFIDTMTTVRSLTPTEKREQAIRRYSELEKIDKLIREFKAFINEVDSICETPITDTYKKVTKTKTKTVLKVVDTETGAVKAGQHFKLLSNFKYGCDRGYVYRITGVENYGDKVFINATKLNKQLTRLCEGTADRSNHWRCQLVQLLNWISNNDITWCSIQEETKEYTLESYAKQTKTKSASQFDIQLIKHTKTNEDIWSVKPTKRVSVEEFKKLNTKMRALGGYYSKFTHSFLFKENPKDKLISG